MAIHFVFVYCRVCSEYRPWRQFPSLIGLSTWADVCNLPIWQSDSRRQRCRSDVRLAITSVYMPFTIVSVQQHWPFPEEDTHHQHFYLDCVEAWIIWQCFPEIQHHLPPATISSEWVCLLFDRKKHQHIWCLCSTSHFTASCLKRVSFLGWLFVLFLVAPDDCHVRVPKQMFCSKWRNNCKFVIVFDAF